MKRTLDVLAAFSIFFLFPLFPVQYALGSADLDRRYALESVGYLKPWDNVDGIFADSVEEAYRAYFRGQGRFKLTDLGKAQKALDAAKAPYLKLIEDERILAKLAKAGGVESLIRSRIQKEGRTYRVRLDWMLFPDAAILSEVSFEWQPPKTEDSSAGWQTFRPAFQKAIGQLVAKIPFKGQVTGRDGKSVTLNIGEDSGLRRGDTVVLSTLQDARKHPKLHTIVGWNFEPVGRARVTEVSESISFARVKEESDPDRPIAKFQKVTKILSPRNDVSETDPEPLYPGGASTGMLTKREIEKRKFERERRKKLNQEEGDEEDDPSKDSMAGEPAPEMEVEDENPDRDGVPRFGYIGFGLWFGSMSRDFTADGVNGKKGDGFFYGARVDSQLWFTENMFADLGLGGALYSYSQKDLATSVPRPTTSDGSQTYVLAAMGYRHLFKPGNFEGPSGFFRGGYRMNAFSLPSSAAEETGSSTYHVGFIGIGTDLPIRGEFSLKMGFDIGLFKTLNEQVAGTAQTATGVSSIDLLVAGLYRISPELKFQLGFEFAHNGANIGPIGAAQGSVSQRTFSVLPSLVYFF